MTKAEAAPGRFRWRSGLGLAFFLLSALLPLTASVSRAAIDQALFDSLVTVQPLWPGYGQSDGQGAPSAKEPEGTAVAIAPGGYLMTALHVVDRASEISVRRSDGLSMPARIVGRDPASDLALLKVEADIPLLPFGPEPALGAPVCALGNPFGTGLSVSCGVVSGLHRSGMGFNPIEDFIQTDAAINPGMSGGALVDREGRLVGLLLAIFTAESDADIGINFAASLALVRRVAEDLLAHGRVERASPGFRVVPLDRDERHRLSGAKVAGVLPGGPAEAAGLRRGDVITHVSGQRVHKARGVVAAVQMYRPGESLEITVVRAGEPMTLTLTLPEPRS